MVRKLKKKKKERLLVGGSRLYLAYIYVYMCVYTYVEKKVGRVKNIGSQGSLDKKL